jgi:hypothetical protein
VDPVALGLIREDAVDEHRERPSLEDADADRESDQNDEDGDPRPVGREIRHGSAVNARLLAHAGDRLGAC